MLPVSHIIWLELRRRQADAVRSALLASRRARVLSREDLEPDPLPEVTFFPPSEPSTASL